MTSSACSSITHFLSCGALPVSSVLFCDPTIPADGGKPFQDSRVITFLGCDGRLEALDVVVSSILIQTTKPPAAQLFHRSKRAQGGLKLTLLYSEYALRRLQRRFIRV
ncbi:hypothetical protein FRC15_008523 [Serendipita sp. 397]|nr:hypothetical protein FRC15_008523 [Serendipita sp. 397]